jgi:hypothetical protein
MTPTIGDMLKQTQAVGALLPAVERHLALQRDVVLVLQPWLNTLQRNAPRINALDICCVLRLEQGVLTLGVRNAALAARVRQVLPRLETGLAQRGWKVTAIRLRVQPESFIEKSESYSKKPLPTAGLAAFADLLGQLPPSDLHTAVARLLKNHQGK